MKPRVSEGLAVLVVAAMFVGTEFALNAILGGFTDPVTKAAKVMFMVAAGIIFLVLNYYIIVPKRTDTTNR